MDSELLRKLKSRRDVVDSSASAYGEAIETPTKDANPRQEASLSSGLVESRTAAWNRRGTAEHSPTPVTSAKRVAFSSASLRGSVPDMGAMSSASSFPSVPSLRKATDRGGKADELSKRLQARRGVVDSEGTTWEKLAGASTADAHVGTSLHQSLDSNLPAHFLDERLEAALRQNLTSRLDGLRRSPDVTDPDSEALTECLHAGESLPWEVLRRGVRTWVCDVWVSDPLCASSDPSLKNSSSVPASAEETPRDMSLTPAILCLASDGELRVCASVLAPSGVSDEADFAKLLGVFEADSLQKLCSVANVSEALSFYFAQSAYGDTSILTCLAARFESDAEAQECALALSDFSNAPLVEEASTEAAKLLTRLFDDVDLATAETSETPEIRNDDGEHLCTTSDCRKSSKRAGGLTAIMTDTHKFLQELDSLAGFA